MADGAVYFPQALANPVFRQLQAAAQAVGQPAYVIGGFVRDFLLGGAKGDWLPKDVDVVTLGSGTKLARAFADLVGAEDVIVYENFGTALVRTPQSLGDWDIEFVGARKESYRGESRKPDVEAGSLADDQLRRDFTLNALSLSLQANDWAQLHDPFGGVRDLTNGILRTPTDPNRTFTEDPLRMLRGIRFAARFGFQLAPETYQAIERNAERINIVSMERVSDELNKMILGDTPSTAFKLMFKTGLLQLIFPEFVLLHGVDRVNGRAHKDNFYHTLQVLDNLCQTTDYLWLRWGAVLHDIAKPQTKRYDPVVGWTFHGHEDKGARMVPKIFARLRLPQDAKMKYVQKLVKLHLRPIALVDDGVSDSAIRRLIVDADEDLEDLMLLCRADITTRDADKVQRFLRNFDHVEERIAEVMERDHLRNWQPPVDGHIIMETFGLNPNSAQGRLIGQIKEAVRNAILDGVIPNEKEAAMAYMHQVAQQVLPGAASPQVER